MPVSGFRFVMSLLQTSGCFSFLVLAESHLFSWKMMTAHCSDSVSDCSTTSEDFFKRTLLLQLGRTTGKASHRQHAPQNPRFEHHIAASSGVIFVHFDVNFGKHELLGGPSNEAHARKYNKD